MQFSLRSREELQSEHEGNSSVKRHIEVSHQARAREQVLDQVVIRLGRRHNLDTCSGHVQASLKGQQVGRSRFGDSPVFSWHKSIREEMCDRPDPPASLQQREAVCTQVLRKSCAAPIIHIQLHLVQNKHSHPITICNP